MQTIDKIIDGKSVSFWLDGNTLLTSISGSEFRRIGTLSTHNSLIGRGENWFEFAAAACAPLPVSEDSEDALALRELLFVIVLDIATQLRKEAA
jgi:hypothetical protein